MVFGFFVFMALNDNEWHALPLVAKWHLMTKTTYHSADEDCAVILCHSGHSPNAIKCHRNRRQKSDLAEKQDRQIFRLRTAKTLSICLQPCDCSINVLLYFEKRKKITIFAPDYK